MHSENDDWSNVIRRLQKVEEQHRRLRLLVFLLPIVVGAPLLLALAPHQEDVIEATRFVVLDSEGRPRAELGMLEGVPYLILRDTLGVPMVNLNLGNGHPALTFTTHGGAPRVHLYAEGARSALEFRTPNGSRLIELLAVNPDQQFLIYTDNDQSQRMILRRERIEFIDRY